ncbi:MAG: hypothetical protein ACOC3W_07785 [Thermodesulfobacteriota bacterium]
MNGIRICLAMALLIGMPVLTGCLDDDDDDENETGRVEFCNFDTVDYDLELRRVQNDAVAVSLSLGAGSTDSPRCRDEDDIIVGAYYAVAYEQGTGVERFSADFLVPEDPDFDPRVIIDSGGEIGIIGGGASGEGAVLVCNGDDEDYLVELRRESDDRVVDSFTLDDVFEFDDTCDDFDDIDAGAYYIRIYEDRDFNDWHDSVIFFLSDDETEAFRIDSTGDIIRQ